MHNPGFVMNRLGKALLILTILLPVSPLQASDSPYRVRIASQPTPIVAGYPFYLNIRVTELLDSADPLLGFEVPTESQVSVEIRSGDGKEMLAGPSLLPAQDADAGVFALEHRFQRSGSYQLGVNIHGADGTTFWYPFSLEVQEDPYGWVDVVFWLALGLAAICVLGAFWKKVERTPGKRLKAAPVTLIFLLLLGLLFLQFLAPSIRHSLWRDSWSEEPWAFAFSTIDEDIPAPIEVLRLEAQGNPCFAVARFAPLQAGRPVALTVSLDPTDGQVSRGKLTGDLQPVGSETSSSDSTHSSFHEPAMAHEMAAPAEGGNLHLDFRDSDTATFHTTVLPVAGGDYQLSLHLMAPPVHAEFVASQPVKVAFPDHTMAGMASGFESNSSSGRLVIAAMLLIFLGAVTLGLLYLRSQWEEARTMDLFRWKPLYRFVRWKYFQPALWLPNLLIFGLVIYLGIWDTQVGGRNLATKLTWTIWWAAIIFAFVFAGKIWCAMCPFGALTLWTNRVFGPRRKLPRMLRNIWIANFAFFFLTWADDFWGIVSTPRYTSLVVVVVALSAMAAGYFFERATFCRHLCPIGGLIGIYSMVSGLELRARDRLVCRDCRGKECYTGTEEVSGCAMLQFPSTLDRNNYCNLCGDCVKSCPYENFAFRIRPFAQDIWKCRRRYLDEAFLAIALVGLTVVVTGHMIEPWHDWMDAIAAWIPFESMGIEDHVSIEKWTFSIVYVTYILVISPLLLLGASALSSRWSAGKASVNSAFRTYAYMFIPVGIGLHLAHNLLHLLKEGAGIVPVLQRTAAKYTSLNLGFPNWSTPSMVSDFGIYWLQMGILGVFYLGSIYLGYRIALTSCPDRKTAVKMVLPMVVLSLAFTLFNVFLLSQPMSARHHH